MKIFITGNRGFVGSYLEERLIAEGHEVIGYDIIEDDRTSGAVYIKGDILDSKLLSSVLKDVDLVIHLAAKHHDFGVSRKEFFKVNVDGTKNVLDCMSKSGIKKIVFFSSVAVYGENDSFCSEETVPNPSSDYGQSKLAAEKVLDSWSVEKSDRAAVVIRPAVIFGPGNRANMYKLIDSIRKKRFFSVGSGDNIKSLVYVENVVDAIIFLINNLKPGIVAYNLVDYPQISSKEIVREICSSLNYKIPAFTLPLGPVLFFASFFDILGKIIHYNFPITAYRIKKLNTPTQFKAEKIRASGYCQRVGIPEGISKMVEWYKKSN